MVQSIMLQPSSSRDDFESAADTAASDNDVAEDDWGDFGEFAAPESTETAPHPAPVALQHSSQRDILSLDASEFLAVATAALANFRPKSLTPPEALPTGARHLDDLIREYSSLQIKSKTSSTPLQWQGCFAEQRMMQRLGLGPTSSPSTAATGMLSQRADGNAGNIQSPEVGPRHVSLPPMLPGQSNEPAGLYEKYDVGCVGAEPLANNGNGGSLLNDVERTKSAPAGQALLDQHLSEIVEGNVLVGVEELQIAAETSSQYDVNGAKSLDDFAGS